MRRWDIVRLEACASTQEEARERGATDGLVVVAKEQTQGRGRRGRDFISPAGGLYLTICLRPEAEPAQVGRLPMIGAAAVAAACRGLGVETLFKWPNDLVVPHAVAGPLGHFRKIAGVLVELDTDPKGAVESARLGIGVNLQRAPSELTDLAGAVDLDRDALLEATLAQLDDGAITDDARWAKVLEALRSQSATLGREVSINDVRGKASAIDDEGALLVTSAAGERRFLTGDVKLLSSP